MSSPLIATLPGAPRNPAGPAPLRRANSVRRTSSIDVTWPEGRDGTACFSGRARDIYTPADDNTFVLLNENSVVAQLAPDRTIRDIAAQPLRPGIEVLIGERGGGYLRGALDEALPQERDSGSPLYLLIDDLSGTSLIAKWAWSRWSDDWMPRDADGNLEMSITERRQRMEGICTGFRPGSSALTTEGQNFSPVPPLQNPADPHGWHALTQHSEVSMRRARRIDIWRENDVIHIDSGFQDSASVPAGGRVAIHEYKLHATADAATLTITSLTADPRVLPYPECPNAPNNLHRLIGAPLRDLRTVVLEKLRRVDGCTHLNDALRAMAEVPILFAHIAA